MRKKPQQAVQKPTTRFSFFPKKFNRAPLSPLPRSTKSLKFHTNPRSESAIQYLPVNSLRRDSETTEATDSSLDLSFLDENGEIDLDDLPPISLLTVFFNDMCPLQLYNPQGCTDHQDCVYLTHTLPNEKHLAHILRKNNFQDSAEVYNLVMTEFPCDARDKFYSTFVNFFAEHRVLSMLKTMIRDHQKSLPEFDFSAIVDGMQRNGWDRVEAIKFVINNHDSEESAEQAQKAILSLIGKMGVEVYKFSEYLTQCKKGFNKD